MVPSGRGVLKGKATVGGARAAVLQLQALPIRESKVMFPRFTSADPAGILKEILPVCLSAISGLMVGPVSLPLRNTIM
jgi:hypothetical protein